MATVSVENRPNRMGTFFEFVPEQPVAVAPALGGIVAIPFTHDWGPVGEAKTHTSFADWQAVFGQSTDTQGYVAVRGAFKGENIPGGDRAGAVYSFRMAGTDAAPAAHTLSNSTPAPALMLEAIYEGEFGNRIRLTVQDHPGDATKDELLILLDTLTKERYVYAEADIAGLADQINARSKYVVATGPAGGAVLTGTKLAVVSAVALTGGDNGDTLVAGDYTAALDQIGGGRFSLFSPANLTDGAILAAILAWSQDLNGRGKRFRTVVGGALDEDESAAAGRSTTIDDPDFVNLGVGSVRDLDLDGRILSTAQLAPRYAGILAGRGEVGSASAARLGGCELVVGPTDSDIDAAFEDGVVVIGQDNDAVSPVRFERSVTTFTTTSDSARPYLIFREPKFVATMHGIQSQVQDYSNSNVLGKLPVTDASKTHVITWINVNVMAPRAAAGIIGPQYTVAPMTNPPPTPTDDFLGFDIGAQYGRSAEQVFVRARMG